MTHLEANVQEASTACGHLHITIDGTNGKGNLRRFEDHHTLHAIFSVKLRANLSRWIKPVEDEVRSPIPKVMDAVGVDRWWSIPSGDVQCSHWTKLLCRLCAQRTICFGDGSGCDERRSRYTQRTIDSVGQATCLDSHWMGVCTGLVVARRTSVLSTVSTAELFIPEESFSEFDCGCFRLGCRESFPPIIQVGVGSVD